MKRLFYLKSLGALFVLVFIFSGCEKGFFEDAFGDSTKKMAVNINYKAILDFEISRSIVYEDNKIDRILDSVGVTNISGGIFDSLDLVVDFYNDSKKTYADLIMSYQLPMAYFPLAAYDDSVFLLINKSIVYLKQDHIRINILHTGRQSDFWGGGIYNASYVYYKFDTLNVLPENYDTTIIGSGQARAIVDFEGNLQFQPKTTDYLQSLKGLVQNDNLFVGKLINGNSDTLSIVTKDFILPDSSSTNNKSIISFKQPNEDATVYIFKLHFTKN